MNVTLNNHKFMTDYLCILKSDIFDYRCGTFKSTLKCVHIIQFMANEMLMALERLTQNRIDCLLVKMSRIRIKRNVSIKYISIKYNLL